MSDMFFSEFEDDDLDPDDPEHQRQAKDAERARERNRKRKRTLSLVMGGAVLAVVVLVIAVIVPQFTGGAGSDGNVTDYSGSGIEEQVDVVIPPGSGASKMGEILAEKEVVASASAFVTAYRNNPLAGNIQPGTYRLNKQQSASKAIAALLDPNSMVGVRFTVIEGARSSVTIANLAGALGVDVAVVEAAAQNPAALGVPQYAVDAAAGCQPADCQIEGWLWASTYQVIPGTDPAVILTEMVDRTKTYLGNRGIPEDQWYDTLIRASLITMEVTKAEDQPKVATVIENRLTANDMCVGGGAGCIGLDATLIYELNKPSIEITPEEWSNSSFAYNTRTNPGLPPTPIDSPMPSAIDAVQNPEAGDWLWYVTVDGSTTEFTADYNEFLTLKAKFKQYECDNWEKLYPDADKPASCPA